MISFLAILLIVAILLLALMQTMLVINYSFFHRDSNLEHDKELALDPDQEFRSLPRAAIILCLRGEEESTPDCIAELLGQKYSNYELHIAFDSNLDPAVRQAEEFTEKGHDNIQLHFFEPKNECSYKCSGIVHVLSQLGDDIEIVAFCDGDAIVDANWLRDLVQPFEQDEKIGATTGNRWFEPYDNAIGARVRKLWNSAAIVQMQAYGIAWGGSMAVRRSTIEACNLKELWSKAFCEDTLLTHAMKRQGLKLHSVPDLVIENKETTTVEGCFEWITRQLLTVRLHHPGWPLVLAHGIVTGLATIVAPIAVILLFVGGYFYEGRSLLIMCAIYQVVNFVLLKVIEHCNQSAIAKRQGLTSQSEAMQRSTRGKILALLVVQVLQPLAAIKTLLMNSVVWRGVEYAITGRRIRVREN